MKKLVFLLALVGSSIALAGCGCCGASSCNGCGSYATVCCGSNGWY
ncbi:hypothetical protein [Legionella jordanis]|nr:hypothetical protein [Legionella jordanis]